MDIKISDHWLRELIETKATPEKIKEYLSLCGQSVNRLTKEGNDFVYEVEVTTNRPDCLSVYGIARELSAILPQFGIPAVLKKIPTLKIKNKLPGLPLSIKISQRTLCPRFTALVFENVKIKPSPKFVQERLAIAGIRSLNNVIDISNYLMLELGQPMHTFDYDKIRRSRMVLRESKEGESVITLDGQERKLPVGTMVIEDGEARLIDLCGIMGAKNSETDENTQRVLLFVQTYNPTKIRKTCQELGFRTEASSRFEKGVDPEDVIPAMERANFLFKEWCEAIEGSELFDVYPHPYQEKTVSVSAKQIKKITGLEIDLEKAKEILASLGFKTKINLADKLISAKVPHYRAGDISIPEDLVEEIARIYGYFNLPSILPPLPDKIESSSNQTFNFEYKIKTALKYWGFTEVMSYSLVSEELLNKTDTDSKKLLKIGNPLSSDMVFLRASLIPSLLEIIAKNNSAGQIFEMANVYLPKSKENLPDESFELTLATTNDNFLELKGIIESLLHEFFIDNLEMTIDNRFEHVLLEKTISLYLGDCNIGVMGKIRPEILKNMGIKNPVWITDIEVRRLWRFVGSGKKYTPLPKYPPIIEDLSFELPAKTFIGPVIETIKEEDSLIKTVELLDSFENTKTFRIIYQSDKENHSNKEIKGIREKIINLLSARFQAQIKGAD